MGGIGYTIPSFIPKYIEDVDVFVLVEFCASDKAVFWYLRF